MQKQAVELMGAVVQKRLDTTWADGERPKDMLQFLVDSAPDAYRTMPRIVETLMMFNMASIHTTTAVSIHLSHLYRLLPGLLIWPSGDHYGNIRSGRRAREVYSCAKSGTSGALYRRQN